MKEHSRRPYMNLSENMYNHRDSVLADCQKINKDLHYQSLRSYNNSFKDSCVDNFAGRIITSSLKRDPLITYHNRYVNSSFLLRQSDTGHNHNNHLNHSATLYPYSFTQYERMKQQMQEKKMAEDKWLEGEISRMKIQDQFIQLKKKTKIKKNYQSSYLPLKIEQKRKVKKMFRNVRQQIRQGAFKAREEQQNTSKIIKQNGNDKKYYRDDQSIDQQQDQNQKPKKPLNHTNKLSSSQVFSSDDKLDKSHSRDQQIKTSIKDMISRHFPKEQHHKKPSTLTSDSFIYVSSSQLLSSSHNNSSILKSHYANRYNYQFERQKKLQKVLINNEREDKRVTDKMIDRAFAFDQLKECESDFEENREADQKIEKNLGSQRDDRKYKDSIEIVFENLNKTPPHNQNNKKKPSVNQNIQTQNPLTTQNQANFSHQTISKSQTQLIKSSNQPSLPSPYNTNHPPSKLLQSHFCPNQQQEMQIFNNRSDQQQHYPIFSPYSQHKHLPHQTHEYMTASLERKRMTKQWGAFDSSKKQAELKNHNLTHNYIDVRELIVDEIEKKKIFNKLEKQDHLLLMGGRKVQNHVHVIGDHTQLKQQRQQHNISQSKYNNNPINIPNTIPHQTNSDSLMVKNLKIQLEILRQQLQDKNKKVVDLQIELMQIKNICVAERKQKQEKQDLSTTTKSRYLNQDSRKEVCFMENQECQMIEKGWKKLKIFSCLMNEKIFPDEELKKIRLQELLEAKNKIKRLQQKLAIQDQAMGNFFEDIAMYQRLNSQLQTKIGLLQSQKDQN